jgi:hypothetical protein
MRHFIKQIAQDGLGPGSAGEQNNIASENFHKKVGMKWLNLMDEIQP